MLPVLEVPEIRPSRTKSTIVLGVSHRRERAAAGDFSLRSLGFLAAAGIWQKEASASSGAPWWSRNCTSAASKPRLDD